MLLVETHHYRAGDGQLRPDLVAGSGNYEIAHLELGRIPKPVTRSSGFHLPRTMDQKA